MGSSLVERHVASGLRRAVLLVTMRVPNATLFHELLRPTVPLGRGEDRASTGSATAMRRGIS